MAATSAPNHDGVMLLEAPFARVPHEELRRYLRMQQRLVERDLTYCSTSLDSLSKSARLDIPSLAKKSGSELERSLDQMIGRIKGLKRKLGSVHESAGSTLSRLDARTGHLNDLQQIQNTSSPAFDEWCRTRLDRMLVDWMLRKGFTQSATMLANNRHIENYVDLNLFTEISRIEGSLIGTGSSSAADVDSQDQASNSIRSCTATLAWCSENKAALRKIRSTLEFDLRLQEFIELTRDRSSQSLQEAINYSRRYLLPYLTPTATSASTKTEEKEEREEQEQQEWIRNQVARVMGLLACGPSGWAYTDLYDVSRWNALQQKFRAAALQIHSLPPQPLLHIALSAGLSSLKLPACYTDDPSRASANDNCPVCDSRGLGVLAKEVPWSHHINSTLVCAISGRIMNENDPPMALPNGRVYSLTALQEMAMASQDGQTIICPRTMGSFKLNDLRKVYIS
ncbi:uncharacterized protein FA14DRAFT_144797 [Meira miltonrushii]|uniref:Uncharacterized protein n=1 Tax=Meira miltonrushii TaxID=1280837 RepID=A0A316VCV6_9BASI|nr:uncharacterized protein FA14DRAFT_144797 [Meira miltonrushii]PWN35144.1 hypothetical protein FA14DRAFT_144797 [Meira miltonrushii]